jgi:hypothetical protein
MLSCSNPRGRLRSLPLRARCRTRPRLEELECRTLPSTYGPGQISHAYGFDQVTLPDGSAGDGTGQTIAIVDAYDAPNVAQDLQAFDQAWGLPDPPTFTVATPQGQPAYNGNWALESSLDVEWAHAMAPGANIVLVEAPSTTFSNMLGAVDYAARKTGASVVSMSWGSSEFFAETSASYDGHFAGHTNLAFVAASGDGGQPIWPSVSPDVVSVGGTTLYLDGAGNYLYETAWSSSGGGISAYESQPAYQSGVVTQSATRRTSPDVAYNADPDTGYYILFNGGWYVTGGTSAGAPQWAALLAIADQGRAVVQRSPLGARDTLNALYSLYNGPDFNSVAGGYDLATGMGSPNANLLISDLVNWGPPPSPAPSSSAKLGSSPLGGKALQPVAAPVQLPPHAVHTPAASQPASGAAPSAASLLSALPTTTPAPPALNLIFANPAAAGTFPPAAGSAAPLPAAVSTDGGALVRLGGQRWYGGGTESVIAGEDDPPAGAARQGSPPVFERNAASSIEVPTVALSSPSETQTPSLSWPQACDAWLATPVWTAGTSLDVSPPLLSGTEDSSPAVAAIAAILGGYWSGPREQPELHRRRQFAGER